MKQSEKLEDYVMKTANDLAGYQYDLVIAAPRAKVYQALTTVEGLQGWWTRTCDVGTSVGAKSTFRFGPNFKVMEIERLQPDTEVRWRCVDSNLQVPGVTRPHEWIGTSVVFQLENAPRGTRLSLEHVGLVPEFECYEICVDGWQRFLGSLEAYVITGHGAPFEEASA